MKRTHMLCFLLGGLLLGPGIGASSAGPITWDFTGEVTAVIDPNGVLGDSIVVGSPYVGSLTFASETPDRVPDDPRIASYDDAIISLSGMVGSNPFSGPTDSLQFISVLNNLLNVGDGFAVFAEIEFLGQLAVFRWDFRDRSGTVFSSTELPLVPSVLTPFDTISVDIFSESEAFRGAIGVQLTAITPEPGSLALLLAGVAIIGRRRVSRSS